VRPRFADANLSTAAARSRALVGAISTTAASLRFASELAEMIPRKEIEIWLFVWIFFYDFLVDWARL
jgi:hypothetical protein